MIDSQLWINSLNVGTIVTSLLVISVSIVLLLERKEKKKARK